MYLSKSICATVTAAVLISGGPALGAINVLNTWNLGENDPGAVAGGPGADPTIDSTGPLNLSKVGTPTYVSTTRAGLGVDFVNNGGFDAGAATNYYDNPSAQVMTGLTDWGIETIVDIDRVPALNEELAVVTLGAGSGGGVILQTYGNGEWAVHQPGSSLATYGAVTQDQETHLALVFNNGVREFYIDGVLTAPTSTIGVIENSLALPAGVRIGGSANGGTPARGFDGQIGVVRTFEFEPGEFSINDTLVPEPAGLGLLGLATLFGLRRRR